MQEGWFSTHEASPYHQGGLPNHQGADLCPETHCEPLGFFYLRV